MCRAVGVSGLRVAACTGAAVKIAPSGCNQSEEGGREAQPWNSHRSHVFRQHFNFISRVAVRDPRPWIHLDLAALVNGFEAQPLPTLTPQPQCPAKDTIIMPAMVG